MQNTGKKLEWDFKASCKDQGIWVLRIKDTYYRAHLNDANAYVSEQTCDFLCHTQGTVFMIECKSTTYKSITIEREGSKGMIKESQYLAMYNALGPHEYAGLILQFQTDTDNQMTYYWPIEQFMEFLEVSDKKSCNALDVVQHGGKVIKQLKKRTHYAYDMKDMYSTIIKEKEEKEDGGETSVQ